MMVQKSVRNTTQSPLHIFWAKSETQKFMTVPAFLDHHHMSTIAENTSSNFSRSTFVPLGHFSFLRSLGLSEVT
jgi:hypothetical protein